MKEKLKQITAYKNSLRLQITDYELRDKSEKHPTLGQLLSEFIYCLNFIKANS